jgi:hypothetical protein
MFIPWPVKLSGYFTGPLHPLRRFHQRIQRMTRAVIAGIHHHELAFQTVCFAKSLLTLGIKLHVVVMRPRRDNHNPLRRDPLGHNAIAHETIQRNDFLRVAQAEARESLKQPRRQRVSLQPASRNGLIRIKIHNPIKEFRPPEAGEAGADYGNKWWTGQGHHHIVAW